MENWEKIQEYILAHSIPESYLLSELQRQTHLKILRPRMLSGHLQGRMLAMFSKMIQPSYIFEIGTFTGYSAICLSEGLASGGQLITCDNNDEIESFARTFLERSPKSSQITFHIGDAVELLRAGNKMFDLIFIDGDKRQYPEYYEAALPYLNKGGYIIADNVLWNGKVVDPEMKKDDYTRGVQQFNTMIQEDSRVENIILPVRDGLMVARRY